MVDFVHTLVIERPFGVDADLNLDTDVDEWGQPIRTFDTDYATVQGLIQSKTAREQALVSQAGAEVGDHTIYMLRRDLTTADRIRDAQGTVYEITGIRDYNFGSLNHIAVDARRVTSAPVEVGS